MLGVGYWFVKYNLADVRLLRASHIKPWGKCEDNIERLDGSNGLMLAPNIDHLFDRGYITFENNGDMRVSDCIAALQLKLLGIDASELINVGAFSDKQSLYLSYHRKSVFKKSKSP